MYYCYKLQLILYTSKLNLTIFLVCAKNIDSISQYKIYNAKSHHLVGLENSFKNRQKVQNVNIYSQSKLKSVHLVLPTPPKHVVCMSVKMLTIMDGP